MSGTQQLSDVAKRYLCEYYDILDDMIEGMTRAELTDSVSHNFIVQMIPHHEGAIRMSENILQYTTCIPLQRIAQRIIAEQTQSIAQMRRALPMCSLCRSSSGDLNLYLQRFRQVTDRMFRRMQEAPATNGLNFSFLREMIPHHEGAIGMSQNLFRFEVCPELCPIVEAIITSQSRGVAEMERLLRTLK